MELFLHDTWHTISDGGPDSHTIPLEIEEVCQHLYVWLFQHESWLLHHLAGDVAIAGDVAEVGVLVVRVHLLFQRLESWNVHVFFWVKKYNLDIK